MVRTLLLEDFKQLFTLQKKVDFFFLFIFKMLSGLNLIKGFTLRENESISMDNNQ